MKIMIVDDHAEMRQTIKNFVILATGKMHQIIEYETGERAMLEYESQQPDFVLMDIELQSISGFTVSEEILKKDPDAKIILVSSYNTPGFRRKAEELGLLAFVAKDKLSDLQPILNSKKLNTNSGVQHETFN
ncbi:MAG: response regulator transcription factor [Balneola sp.]